MRRCSLVSASSLVAGVVFASGALAQVPRAQPEAGQQQAAQPAGGTAAVNAGVTVGERFAFSGLELSVALPENATAVEDGVGGNNVGRVRDHADTWQVTIERRKSSNTNLKLKDVADAALMQLLAAFGTTVEKDGALKNQPQWRAEPDFKQVNGKMVSVATLLLREPAPDKVFTIRNAGKQLAAERFYVYMPAFDNRKAVVRAVTFVELAPGEFLTFDLITNAVAPSQADAADASSPAAAIDMQIVTAARAPYEMIVASTELVDQSGNETQRAASVQAAKRVIDGVSSEQLQQIVNEFKERWERVYRPSPTGNKDEDEEVAYRRVMMSYGPRRNMPGIQVRGVEAATQGFMVRIDARMLESENVIDSQSVFFMTPDRSEESWSVKMTIRTGATSVTHTEVGARVGTDMKVTITSDDGKNERVIRPQVATEGYISRVESYLLPMILVRSAIPTVYGTYAYQSQTERVQYRRDVLEQPKAGTSGTETAANSAAKPFTLRTKLSDDQPVEQVSLFDAKGSMIRSELTVGVLSEPSSLAEIKKIWKAKGLPVD